MKSVPGHAPGEDSAACGRGGHSRLRCAQARGVSKWVWPKGHTHFDTPQRLRSANHQVFWGGPVPRGARLRGGVKPHVGAQAPLDVHTMVQALVAAGPIHRQSLASYARRQDASWRGEAVVSLAEFPPQAEIK